jgi:hypothetical protein
MLIELPTTTNIFDEKIPKRIQFSVKKNEI